MIVVVIIISSAYSALDQDTSKRKKEKGKKRILDFTLHKFHSSLNKKNIYKWEKRKIC